MSEALSAREPASESKVLFRADGLHKSFGGVHAVRNISLQVLPGSVFAIIGPNGAGKSTLLNLISGVHRPDSGTMTLDNVAIADMAAHRRVRHGLARTFQKIRLFKQLSVLDNVVAGFHTHHEIPFIQYLLHGPTFQSDRNRCREEARALLQFVDLGHRVDLAAGSLAYGEQRMLELARALATRPRLLLVDEPAAGLNRREVDALLQRIATLRADGTSVLLVEHNMDLVMNVADRVLVMDYGQHLFEGTPREVQSHPDVIAAYLGGELQ